MTFLVAVVLTIGIVAWMVRSDYRRYFKFSAKECIYYIAMVLPWTYGTLLIFFGVWRLIVAGWMAVA